MKKAKEYAEQFEKNPSMDTLTDIITTFIQECVDLGISRKCQSNEAMSAVFNEQERKWKALCRMIDGLRPDGFRNMIDEQYPELAQFWTIRKDI